MVAGRPHLVAALLALAACGGPGSSGETPARAPIEPRMSLEEAVGVGASLLWVGAHPDDDILLSPLWVRLCAGLGARCEMLVLTAGEGGTCYAPPCEPDLGTVRAAEMDAAARAYGATAEIAGFSNASAEGDAVADVLARWRAEGDPEARVLEALARMRPDVVLSLHPSHGFTGHVEHRAVATVVERAVARAEGRARPTRLYRVVNRYLMMLPVGWDDGRIDERIAIGGPCPGSERSCAELGLAAAASHASQWPFVLALGLAGSVAGELTLERIDP